MTKPSLLLLADGSEVSCPHRVIAENFTTGSQFNGAYSVMDDDWANERVVYRHEKLPQGCIWWHKQYRHWWIGDCRKKGLNHGYAWLEPDLACPTDLDGEGSPLWRRGGTDEALPLVGIKRSNSFSIPVLQFGTPDEERVPGFISDFFTAKLANSHTSLSTLSLQCLIGGVVVHYSLGEKVIGSAGLILLYIIHLCTHPFKFYISLTLQKKRCRLIKPKLTS